MENVMNYGFVELSANETEDIDGGIGFLAACAAVTAVCAAVGGCYKVGTGIGKFIRNITD